MDSDGVFPREGKEAALCRASFAYLLYLKANPEPAGGQGSPRKGLARRWLLDEAAEALHRSASVIADRNLLLQGQAELRAQRWRHLQTLPAWVVSLLTLVGTVLVYALARLLGVPIPGGAP